MFGTFQPFKVTNLQKKDHAPSLRRPPRPSPKRHPQEAQEPNHSHDPQQPNDAEEGHEAALPSSSSQYVDLYGYMSPDPIGTLKLLAYGCLFPQKW